MYDYMGIVDQIESSVSEKAMEQIADFELALAENVTAILDYCNAYKIRLMKKGNCSWTKYFLDVSAVSDKFDMALDMAIAKEFANVESLEQAIDRLRRLVKD